MSDEPPVVVVTGASRGAGQGIAIGLGSHGCTVYVTGRSAKMIGAEMAVKYGLKDVGGRQPPSYRDTHKVAPFQQGASIIR